MTGLPPAIHPARISACFVSTSAPALVLDLLREPRFAARLADLVRRHHHLEDVAEEDWDHPDSLIAERDLEGLESLALCAGIVFRAQVFVREIRGPVLAALAERFGSQAMRSARLHRDLAGDRAHPGDLDALELLVREEGRACLAAWIASRPAALARRVRLKWPDDAAVPITADPELLSRGPEILRRLVLDEELET